MLGRLTNIAILRHGMSLLPLVAVLHSAECLADDPRDLLIVVSKSVSQKAFTHEELKAIFFKQRIAWRTGEKIIPIHAPVGSEARSVFTERILGMTADQELRHWDELQIMKGLSRPQEVDNAQYKRLRAVFETPDSISYVLRKNYVKGVVKVVMRVPGS